jgi:hypothetical protein
MKENKRKEREGSKKKSSFILMHMKQKFASPLDHHPLQRQ